MKRILIVEDKASSRELLRTVLENQGFVVSEAADGEGALQKARAELPDLILLDLHMPVRGGYEVLKELRQEPRFASVPIVLSPPARCKETAKRQLRQDSTPT